MEWVVTTAKSVEEAKEQALDQLGVARDDAEFEIVEEAKTGLFGRVKTEARVRARVKPAQVRPKQDRRDRRRNSKSKRPKGDRSEQDPQQSGGATPSGESDTDRSTRPQSRNDQGRQRDQDQSGSSNGQRGRSKRQRTQKEQGGMEHDNEQQSEVTPQEVGDAATAFMSGLVDAFGANATTDATIEGTEIDVRVSGDELGLLVGPGGRTLTAVQDLARVSSQRRLGDHETRLRIDVGGYREKRKEALEKFALAVANQVIDANETKALEPMSSADRKVVHDAITGIDGVTSRSEGDEPRRRVVISPA